MNTGPSCRSWNNLRLHPWCTTSIHHGSFDSLDPDGWATSMGIETALEIEGSSMFPSLLVLGLLSGSFALFIDGVSRTFSSVSLSWPRLSALSEKQVTYLIVTYIYFVYCYHSSRVLDGVRTNLHSDISLFEKFTNFFKTDNTPFVALQGWTILRSWVCTAGKISVHILSKSSTIC